MHASLLLIHIISALNAQLPPTIDEIFVSLNKSFTNSRTLDASCRFLYTEGGAQTINTTPRIIGLDKEQELYRISVRCRISGDKFRFDSINHIPSVNSTDRYISTMSDGVTQCMFDWDSLTLYEGKLPVGGGNYNVLVPFLVPFRFLTCPPLPPPEFPTLRSESSWAKIAQRARVVGAEVVDGASCTVVEIECDDNIQSDYTSIYRVYFSRTDAWFPVRYEIYSGNPGRIQERFTATSLHSSDNLPTSYLPILQAGRLEAFNSDGVLIGTTELTVENATQGVEIEDSIFSIPSSHIDQILPLGEQPSNTQIGHEEIPVDSQTNITASMMTLILGGLLLGLGVVLLRTGSKT